MRKGNAKKLVEKMKKSVARDGEGGVGVSAKGNESDL